MKKLHVFWKHPVIQVTGSTSIQFVVKVNDIAVVKQHHFYHDDANP